MKCDKCKYKIQYTTGFDEYPPYTTLEYCAKWHWENGEALSVGEDIAMEDPWENCKDFEEEK